MKKLIKLILLVVLGLFCWGWVSNVIVGKMTTGEYIHRIRLGFRQFAIDLREKILADSKTAVKTGKRIARDTSTLYDFPAS